MLKKFKASSKFLQLMLALTLSLLTGCEASQPSAQLNNQYAENLTDHKAVPKISDSSPSVTDNANETQANPRSDTQVNPLKPSFSNIPILMIHYVRTVDKTKDLLGYNLSIEPESFNKLIAALDQKGYHTIHAADLLATQSLTKLPDKPILIIFDDGYEDFFSTALPTLQQHHFTASEAIITAKMQGDPQGQTYMNEEQVKQIDQAGIEILSHTITHQDLSKATAKAQEKELSESKSTLEKLLHHAIPGLVYPSGKYNDDTLKLAAQNNYQIAFTTQPGLASSSQNLLELPRLRVDNRYSIESILKKL